jgi:hypothetical protein
MPEELRALLISELAAGNRIAEVGHSHPAPPVGAYFMLARPVTTRPRESGGGLHFRERNSSLYSGEFTDERRFYFILEPPQPATPETDMNTVRSAIAADRRGAAAMHGIANDEPSPSPTHTGCNARSLPLVERFKRSMQIDYEGWREGTSYNLALLAQATPEERREIEHLLLTRTVHDWRDVEALAAIDTLAARLMLRQTLQQGPSKLAVAVLRYAPALATTNERVAVLVRALEHDEFYGGLTYALQQVETFHPPAVVDALLRGVLNRHDGVQVHFAAMLMFIHGKAKAPFDWDQRPYFLQFNTDDPAERKTLLSDLCARIGVRPDPYLQN